MSYGDIEGAVVAGTVMYHRRKKILLFRPLASSDKQAPSILFLHPTLANSSAWQASSVSFRLEAINPAKSIRGARAAGAANIVVDKDPPNPVKKKEEGKSGLSKSPKPVSWPLPTSRRIVFPSLKVEKNSGCFVIECEQFPWRPPLRFVRSLERGQLLKTIPYALVHRPNLPEGCPTRKSLMMPPLGWCG